MANSPAASQIDTVDLSTLLLPLADQMLIMPSDCIIEIMRLRELQSVDDVPDWVYGALKWRRMKVPVISFEALNGDSAPSASSGSRIVVINAVSNSQDLPYIGMITQGVPHLLRVTPEDIQQTEGKEAGPAELQRIIVFGQRASIPNLEFVQSQLRGVSQFGELQESV